MAKKAKQVGVLNRVEKSKPSWGLVSKKKAISLSRMDWQPYLAFGKGNKVNNDELMFLERKFLIDSLGRKLVHSSSREGAPTKNRLIEVIMAAIIRMMVILITSTPDHDIHRYHIIIRRDRMYEERWNRSRAVCKVRTVDETGHCQIWHLCLS